MNIKELREAYGVQQKTLANILGISSNTLSQYETGKRSPNIDIIKKIMEYFNVSSDYVYGLSDTTTCHDCGLTYCPNETLDIETHKEHHALWKAAKDRYGFCYANHGINEMIKSKNRAIASNDTLPINERYDAQIEVFKCLFSRNLSAVNFRSDFIDFEDYIAMLLNQKNTEKKINSDIYKKLVNEFGKKEGMPDGETYYYMEASKKCKDLAAHLDGEEFSDEQIKRIMDFAAFIKSEDNKNRG